VNDGPTGEFRRGIDLFNRLEFFECHEVLEEVWRHERGARRLFLQSLIHLAVAFYHHRKGNAAGMQRQLQKGLKKLAAYLPEYDGLETMRLYLESVAFHEAVARGETVSRFPAILMAPRPATTPPPARR